MTGARAEPTPTGRVHIVGAGPGDPLLLTRRAVRLLGEADVVVADRRSAEPLVALASASAQTVYVGLTADGKAWSLAEIVELMATHAGAGRTVVRLKSGDPFVCSRGAEERAALVERGVRVEVTPGVTAAFAVPVAAGVDRGRTVTVASGDDDPLAAPVPWAQLAAEPEASLIVLTGRAHQGRIAHQLLAGGQPAASPVHVVHGVTRPSVDVRATTLADLGSVRLPPPAAFVVSPIGGQPKAHENGGRRAHP